MAWSDIAAGVNASCIRVFGEPIVYQMLPDAPVSLNAVLEIQNLREDTDPGRYARVFVNLADLPSPQLGAQITMPNGLVYNLVQIEADRDGGAYLTLHNPDFGTF
jgi:hypothetical protein